jgi:hypothetical protein
MKCAAFVRTRSSSISVFRDPRRRMAKDARMMPMPERSGARSEISSPPQTGNVREKPGSHPSLLNLHVMRNVLDGRIAPTRGLSRSSLENPANELPELFGNSRPPTAPAT